jgi:hypothetical protein
MAHTIPVLLACASACALAPAQTRIVLPRSHAAFEGTGATNVPLGRSTPVRVQAAYDGLLFPGAVTVQRLALRLDGGQTASGKRIEHELRASTSGWGVTFLQATFAQNPGADETVVVDRKTFDLPPLGQASTPNAFHAALPLDRTFRYDPARGALLLDWTVFGQAPGAYPLDATWLCDSPQQPVGPAGCGPGSGPVLRADCLTAQVLWGRSFTLRVSAARPGAATFLFLGTIEQGSWGGFPLPFDLGVLGAPGCPVSIDLVAGAGGPADGSGTFSRNLFVPSLPALQLQWVRFQGVALDPLANALGVVTSQAAKVQVCGWEPVARVWATPATAAVGTRELGIAPVLELTVQ